jgi:hypothetical protein
VAVGIALIVVGVALLGVTAWFWRASRLDDPVLAPLEVIGDRRFRAADEATRREMLRQVRSTVER